MNVLDQTVQIETHDNFERAFACGGRLADGTLCGMGHSWERETDAWAFLPTALGWRTFRVIICKPCGRWHGRIDRPEMAENLSKEKV